MTTQATAAMPTPAITYQNTTTLNLQPLPEFNPDVEVGGSLAKRWDIWTKDFDMYIVASGVTDTKRKRALLLYVAGSRVREIFNTLLETGEDCETALERLKDYFEPQKNKRYEIFKFRQLRQQEDESLDSFHTRLRRAATNCDFHDSELEIEQQIVVGGKSSTIRKKALRNPEYTLKDMLVDGRGKESSLYQSKDIEGIGKDEIMDKLSTNKEKAKNNSKTCYNCGGQFPHPKYCPARGKQCEQCLKYNHFSSCCRQRSNSKEKKDNVSTRSQIKEVQSGYRMDVKTRTKVEPDTDSSSSSEEEMFVLECTRIEKPNPKVNIVIKGIRINMTVDTGASINVIDEVTFNRGVRLHKTKVKAYTYGGKQPVKFLGKFRTVMETKKSMTVADVYVVNNKNSGCLLSSKTAQKLSLITLNLDKLETEKLTKKEQFSDIDIKAMLKRHDKIFKGVGRLKGHMVKLNIDETVKPVSLKQRKVPFHIRKKVSEALKKLLDDDIIERIPENQPTPWVSPIVAVPQANDSIRLCIDMRKPNVAIKRTNFPIPTLPEIDIKMNGACYFSKLDIRQAFHQIELEEASRYITTFITHKGLFRYKVLNFGNNAATEIFQQLLQTVLGDIEGVFNIHDDIIVYGITKDGMKAALSKCLKRLEEVGLTLNLGKCEFHLPCG